MTDAFFEALDSVLDEEVAKKERGAITLTEAQTYIDCGNKVFLLTPSAVNEALVIGRIVMPEEWKELRDLVKFASSVSSWNAEVPSDEEILKQHDEGYRLGLFFYEGNDLGYVASYHISRLYPLTEEEFEGIREANCVPGECAKLPYFGELEDSIITALENQPDSPYRKQCENPACGSKRVVIAEYFEAVNYSPAALRMNVIAQTLDVLTTHAINQQVHKVGKRVFHCLACKWESDELSEEQYPEVHTCNHNRSALEALFDVERLVI